MTEKVISLSGGLCLGIVFALFLSVGATQTITSPIQFDYPSITRMVIAQDYGTSTPVNDTTPVISVASPSSEDRGRITRIATMTETTDPAFTTPTETTEAQFTPKNWENSESPKIDNSLQRTNLQRSYIAASPQANTYTGIGPVVARQSNFTAIIVSNTGPNESGGQPTVADNDSQNQGSPSVAQNNPAIEDDEEQGEPQIYGPSITSLTPKPVPDSFSNGNTEHHVNPDRPDHNYTSIRNGNQNEDSNTGGDPGNPVISQRCYRPEVD